MITQAAIFTDVLSYDQELNCVVVQFGDSSRIDRSGIIRIELPVLEAEQTRYAKAIGELEALKAIIANPWRLCSEYHHHEPSGTVGTPWRQRGLNIIQVSQGATRKALLAAIGDGDREHPVSAFAKWGVFWLEGAKLQVAKKLTTAQRDVGARYVNEYAITASTSRENVVTSPVLGRVEISEHALSQFTARSGFKGVDPSTPYPEQATPPASCALSLSRWLMKEELVEIRLADNIAKKKERRYSRSEFWGVPEQLFRFTTVPLDSASRRLVTVYVRPKPVGMDPEEHLTHPGIALSQ
jgi:hypothetical protein